jgi:hypothetical protein
MNKITEKEKADIAFKNYVIDRLSTVDKRTKADAKTKAKAKAKAKKKKKIAAPKALFGHGLMTFKSKTPGIGKA